MPACPERKRGAGLPAVRVAKAAGTPRLGSGNPRYLSCGLEEAHHCALVVDVDADGGGLRTQPRHRLHLARNRIEEARPGREPHG